MGDPKDDSKVDVLGVRVDRAERDIEALEASMGKGFEAIHSRISEVNRTFHAGQLSIVAALAESKLTLSASLAESKLSMTTALERIVGERAGMSATAKWVLALIGTLLGVVGYFAGRAGP